MHIPDCISFRRVFLPGMFLLGVIGILASGGGGSSDDDDERFPTPEVPADAVVLSPANAREIAEATLDLTDALSEVASFKTDEQASLSDIVKRAIEPLIELHKRSFSVAEKTEDLSIELCISGTARLTYEESGNTTTGSITYNDCKIATDITIDGKINVDSTYNDATQNYSIQFGGSLSLAIEGENITIVMNFKVSGNDGTGNYSANINFSVDGIPEGGFLVTTEESWMGNEFSGDYTAGKLLVEGGMGPGGLTRLEIIVVPPNMAEVWLDEGAGAVYFDTIPLL